MLTGIDVRFAGFDAYDVEPAKIPDLFASRPIVVFGKWRGRVGGSIEISGKTGRGAYQTSIAGDAAERGCEPRRAAASLGANAHRRPVRLRPRRHQTKRVSPQITSLGLTYGLLTKYTSFIAVHEVVRRTTDGADDVDQPLPLPEGVSDRAVGVTSGPEPELVWVFAIAVALLGGCTLLRSASATGVSRRSAPRASEDEARACWRWWRSIAWGLKRHYADAPRGRPVVDPGADGAGWLALVTGTAFAAVPR